MLQPEHKLRVGDSVFEMRLFRIFNLYVIFNAFHEDFRILPLRDRHFFWNALIKCIVYSLRIQQDDRSGFMFFTAAYISLYGFREIWFLLQFIEDIIREFSFISI